MLDMWDVLGMEPCKDPRLIKRSYAVKLRECHPEDDPEGFQVLNSAYKAALRYAQQNQPDIALDNGSAGLALQSDGDSLSGGEEGKRTELSELSPQEPPQEPPQELQQEPQQEQAHEELKRRAEAFLNKLFLLVRDKQRRKIDSEWLVIFSEPLLDSIEFRQMTSFYVFQAFAEHYADPAWSEAGHFINRKQLKKMASIYLWPEYQLELQRYFHPSIVNTIMMKIEGNNQVNPELERAWQHQEGGLRRFYYKVVLFLLVMSILVVFSSRVDDRVNNQNNNQLPTYNSQLMEQNKVSEPSLVQTVSSQNQDCTNVEDDLTFSACIKSSWRESLTGVSAEQQRRLKSLDNLLNRIEETQKTLSQIDNTEVKISEYFDTADKENSRLTPTTVPTLTIKPVLIQPDKQISEEVKKAMENFNKPKD